MFCFVEVDRWATQQSSEFLDVYDLGVFTCWKRDKR